MRKFDKTGTSVLPKINIAILIQRANDIFVAARRDRSDLEAYGLSWDTVLELANLVTECSVSEAKWRLAHEDRIKETAALEAYVLECKRFRGSVVRKITTVAEVLPSAFHVPRFVRNSSRADLIQDLHDLYIFTKTYKTELDIVNFDPVISQEAIDRSNKLSMLDVHTKLNRSDFSQVKEKRDMLCMRAYTLIQEICALARIVFENDPSAKDYLSGKRTFI